MNTLLKSIPAALVFGIVGVLGQAESVHGAVESSGSETSSRTRVITLSGPVRPIEHTPDAAFGTFDPEAPTQPGLFKPVPTKLELKQTPKLRADRKTLEFKIELGGTTFSTIEELKTGISRLPKGSEITWSPGCCLIGGEPLQANLKELQKHCDDSGVLLIIVPSG